MLTADRRLVRELRTVLDDVDRGLAAQPAPMPPWEDLQAFIRQTQVRRRRRFTAMVVAAAAVAVGLILAQVAVFPTTQRGEPAHFEDEVRGSLAGDEAWLAGLREWASTHRILQQGDEVDQPAEEPVRNLKVIYASDVGDYRAAIVAGSWPGQGDYSVELWARRGADPEDLSPFPAQPGIGGTFSRGLSPTSPHKELTPQGLAGLGAAAYLVSDREQEVVLQETPTIDADATVTQHRRSVDGKDGVYEVALTEPGRYAILVPGQSYRDFSLEPVVASNNAITHVQPQRGGDDSQEATLKGIALGTWLTSRQPFSNGLWLLQAQEPGAITEKTPHRAVAGILILSSGAWVLAAGHLSVASGQVQSELDTARLIPKGDDDRTGIAWQVTTNLKDTSTDLPVTGTAALGPFGTATVEWSGSDGVTTSPARNDLARTGRTDVDSVRFLDADGNPMGSREEVREGLAPRFDGSYDGEPVKVDEENPFWLLPEVREGLAGF